MKTCRQCKSEKPLEQFYKHAQMGDGYLNHCRDCVKERVTKHREQNLGAIQAYDRARGRTEARLERNKIHSRKVRQEKRPYNKNWSLRNKEKKQAHLKVRRAILAGVLVRQPCEACRNKKVEAHHDDYSKPLDVRWLCRKHHAEVHRKYKDEKIAA